MRDLLPDLDLSSWHAAPTVIMFSCFVCVVIWVIWRGSKSFQTTAELPLHDENDLGTSKNTRNGE